MSEFEVDGSYRRFGAVVIGGSPLRLFRVTAAGERVLDAVERGAPLPANHAVLTDRLVDAGAIHPRPGATTATAADVTLVVPAWRWTPTLPPEHDALAEVIVVDDASDPPLSVDGATVVRLPVNRGPAAARNAGLARVETPIVAFVDTDVQLPDGWLDPLLGWFADDRVALVAPRVAGAPGESASVDSIERRRGSLDLGPTAGRIAAGSRISYVPAAAIVCRVDALRAVGAFDEALRWGEDVDVVWRLAEASWRCRYEPAVVAAHQARPTVRAWLRQQYGYGTSAAPLAARHPGALAPLRISGWSVAAWAVAVVGRRPLAAAALTAGTAVALQRKLRGVPPEEAARLAGLGTLAAGEQIANAAVRAWAPVTVALLAARRTRPVAVLALIAPATLGAWRTRSAARSGPAERDAAATDATPPLIAPATIGAWRTGTAARSGPAECDAATTDAPRPSPTGRRSLATPWSAVRAGGPLHAGVLWLAGDLAYCAGVWRGALRQRSIAALVPDLSNWPPRAGRGKGADPESPGPGTTVGQR